MTQLGTGLARSSPPPGELPVESVPPGTLPRQVCGRACNPHQSARRAAPRELSGTWLWEGLSASSRRLTPPPPWQPGHLPRAPAAAAPPAWVPLAGAQEPRLGPAVPPPASA